MAFWYVSNFADANGDYVVHHDSCYELSLVTTKSLIGEFTNCHDAVAKSKKQHHPQSNGCPLCGPDCHRT